MPPLDKVVSEVIASLRLRLYQVGEAAFEPFGFETTLQRLAMSVGIVVAMQWPLSCACKRARLKGAACRQPECITRRPAAKASGQSSARPVRELRANRMGKDCPPPRHSQRVTSPTQPRLGTAN